MGPVTPQSLPHRHRSVLVLTTGFPGKSCPVLFIDFSTTSFSSFQIFYHENATLPKSEMNSECCFYKALPPFPVPTPPALPEHSPGHTWLAPVYPHFPSAWGASTPEASLGSEVGAWSGGQGVEPGPRRTDPQPWGPHGVGIPFVFPTPPPCAAGPTPHTLVWTPTLDPLPNLGALCLTFCLQMCALTLPLPAACAAPRMPCAHVWRWRGT